MPKRTTLTIPQMLDIHKIEYVEQYKFHPKRKWRFDFAVPSKKVAIEYEGINSKKSRHTTISGYTEDCEKYSEAAIFGWKVIRVTAQSLVSGVAYDQIIRALGK